MMPLTPDEVMARVPFADGALRFQLGQLAEAGLAVVAVGDASDTEVLEQALHSIDEFGCERYVRGGRCFDPGSGRSRAAAFGAERWCDPCIARDALNRAGGSPGGSGTVPQETSADREVRANPHPRIQDRLVEASETPAGQDKWLDRYAVDVPNLLALLDVATRGGPPPFPGAHRGPVVDGQPTWGASYHAIPNGWDWEWSINGESWYPATAMPPAGRAQWVQVREALQAPRWEVDEDGWLTFDRCIAMILTHPHTLFDGVEMDRSARDKARDALVADVRAARQHQQLRESIAAEAELVGGDDHHYTGTDVALILHALLSGETD